MTNNTINLNGPSRTASQTIFTSTRNAFSNLASRVSSAFSGNIEHQNIEIGDPRNFLHVQAPQIDITTKISGPHDFKDLTGRSQIYENLARKRELEPHLPAQDLDELSW